MFKNLVMFKWFKFLRNNDKDFDECIAHLKHINMPKVKPCKEENDISEPVTSFLECFKNKPRRFRVVRTDNKSNRLVHHRQHYKFTDTKTSESWKISYRPSHETLPYIEDVTWMTNSERELIFEVIAGHYRERAERLAKIRKDRHIAKVNKERYRLTAIYKEG